MYSGSNQGLSSLWARILTYYPWIFSDALTSQKKKKIFVPNWRLCFRNNVLKMWAQYIYIFNIGHTFDLNACWARADLLFNSNNGVIFKMTSLLNVIIIIYYTNVRVEKSHKNIREPPQCYNWHRDAELIWSKFLSDFTSDYKWSFSSSYCLIKYKQNIPRHIRPSTRPGQN